MESKRNFKEHLLKILSATGYGLNLKPGQLTVCSNNPKLKQFYECFRSNITKENCLTVHEQSEFCKLEENGDILYGEELEEAVQSYFSKSPYAPLSMAETTLEAKKDELSFLQQQFSVKTQLLSTINASISAKSEDISKLSRQKKEAEEWNMECATNVTNFNNLLNKKLDSVKEALESGRKKYSVLVQNNEISADEGIDTLASDNLDASLLSNASVSTIASSLPCNETSTNFRLLCQMSLEKYGKQNRRFNKIIEFLSQSKKIFKKIADNGLEIDLELLNILDRLSKQKKVLILNAAEIDSLKTAQKKIYETIYEIQRGRGKPVLSKIKSEASETMDYCESEDSFSNEFEDMDESCKMWAESRILKLICELQRQKLEDYKVLINQLENVKKDLNLKLVSDRVLYEALILEEDQIECFFEKHKKLDDMVRELMLATKKRIEIMKENLQDYQDYESLPLEDCYEPIRCLAAMLGSERKHLAQAVKELNEHLECQHNTLTNHLQQNMHSILQEDQQLTSCYNSEVWSKKSTIATGDKSLDLYQAIQTRLNMMDDLIEETNLNLNLNQSTMAYQEEESEIEQMLRDKIIQLKKE